MSGLIKGNPREGANGVLVQHGKVIGYLEASSAYEPQYHTNETTKLGVDGLPKTPGDWVSFVPCDVKQVSIGDAFDYATEKFSAKV